MSKQAKLLIILAITILLGVMSVATIIIFKAENDVKSIASKTQSKVINPKNIVLLNVKEPIISNINKEEEAIWIKVKITLEVDKSEKASKEFIKEFQDTKTGKQVVIRDTIIHTLKEQTKETVNKEDAQDKIGKQIETAINKILGEEIIQRVYFEEFIIQQ